MGRLLRTAAHAAVASSVHGRVQRRQAARFARPAPQPAAAPAPVQAAPPAPPAGPDFQTKIDLLTQLGQLRDAGILSEAEFEVKKAEILR